TALPADLPGDTPEQQLAAFRDRIRQTSKIKHTSTTATFIDRDGIQVERTFNGDTLINGQRLAYETWPLLENPWMRQEWNGNLTLTDGKVQRIYDTAKWIITESNTP
ncbi:MAG: hypothetical protein ACFCU8_14465, partial [Thermosynechococcaceae cyanobacterium]